MPHCPRFSNLKGLPSTLAVGLMNASFKSFVRDSGRGLPFHLLQLGLRIEEIHLARRAFHEEEDDVLRLGREVRRLWRERRHGLGGAPFASEQLGESDGADASRAIAEEPPSGLDRLIIAAASSLLLRYEFVQVEQHRAEIDPGGDLRPRDARQFGRRELLRRLGILSILRPQASSPSRIAAFGSCGRARQACSNIELMREGASGDSAMARYASAVAASDERRDRLTD